MLVEIGGVNESQPCPDGYSYGSMFESTILTQVQYSSHYPACILVGVEKFYWRLEESMSLNRVLMDILMALCLSQQYSHRYSIPVITQHVY